MQFIRFSAYFNLWFVYIFSPILNHKLFRAVVVIFILSITYYIYHAIDAKEKVPVRLLDMKYLSDFM